MASDISQKVNRPVLVHVEGGINGQVPEPLPGKIAKSVRLLYEWAYQSHLPIISVVVSGNSRCSNTLDYNPLLPIILTPHSIRYGANGRNDLPPALLTRYLQVVFDLPGPDPFSHPRLDRLLDSMRGGEFLLCGRPVVSCLKNLAVGLLMRKSRTWLVPDAIGPATGSPRTVSLALRKMKIKGARQAPLETLIKAPHHIIPSFSRPHCW